MIGLRDSLGLVLTSVTAVAHVLLLCALGAFLAHPRVNILTGPARKNLNKLVFVAFLPALIFEKLGEAVTLEKIIHWWFLPVNVAVACTLGAAIGWLVSVISKVPPRFRALTIACCTIGNLGNVPLVLVSAVCSDSSGNFRSHLPPSQQSADSCAQQGIALVAYGMWMAVVVMWTFVYNLLKPPGGAWGHDYERLGPALDGGGVEMSGGGAPKGGPVAEGGAGAEGPPVGSSEDPGPTLDLPARDQERMLGEGQLDALASKMEAGGALPQQQQHSPVGPGSPLEWQPAKAQELPVGALWQQLARQVASWHLGEVFTPPTTAAMLALFVGAVPPVKRLFFGPGAPLRLLRETIGIVGQALIPSMMLVLGGNLSKGPGKSEMGWQTVVAVAVTRLVVLPCVGIAVVLGADRAGMLPADDPLFRFVLLLQFAMPTAINVGTVAALHGVGEVESSIILFWEYLLAPATMMVFMVVFMAILF